MSSVALITIDTQRDTLDGQSFEIPGTSAALPNIRLLLDKFRVSNKPIIHIVRLYKPDGSNVDLCRKELVQQGAKLVLAGTSGSQIAPDLFAGENVILDEALLLSGGIQNVSEDEVIMYKPRWGAFYKTPLERYLREKDITTIVFCGCNFPNCPRTSIYEASERDFKIILASDAISGLYEKGITELKNIGVHVMPTKDVLDLF